MESDLEVSAHTEHAQVVHLAHARDGQRRGVDTLAERGFVFRLDVDDDVAVGQRGVQRRFDGVGGRVALADGCARRNADDDVGEMSPRRLTHP